MIKDRIKELREKNGLTISAFAKSLGISPTSASLYESGKQNPGKKTIAKICEVYGVEEDWLTKTNETDKVSADVVSIKEKKKSGRTKKVAPVAATEEKIDIPAILARVEEVGVRKAAEEAGVPWQTVSKWKRDAEEVMSDTLSFLEELVKEMPIPEDFDETVMPTPEEMEVAMDVLDAYFKNVMTQMATPAEEERKGQATRAVEAVKEPMKTGRKKKDAALTTPTAQKKEEKKEEKKQEKKQSEENDDVVDEEEKKTAIIIQSPMGGSITPEQILKKIPAGSDSVYVRVDENKLYWVKGSESGAVDIWG